MTKHILLRTSFALLLAATAACGASEEQPESAAKPVEASPAPAAEPAIPAPATEEAPTAPAALAVTVVEMTNTGSGPSQAPATIKAMPAGEKTEVLIENLSHYCEPAPSFTAAVEGDVLKLTLAEPQQPVSKCFGPFTGKLNLDVSTANLAWVVVVDHEGKERLKGEAFRVK